MLPDPSPDAGAGGSRALRRRAGAAAPESAWDDLRRGRWRLGASAAVGALVVVAGVVVLLVLGAGLGAAQVPTPTPGVAVPARTSTTAPASAAVPPAAATPSAPTGTGEVVVDVTGQVASPGLVRLAPGSRVDDAVRAAGGALPAADLPRLNLARPLADGEQVVVPSPGQPLTAAGSGAPAAAGAGGAGGTGGAGGSGTTAAGPVDLNTASLADLDGLPGVGPVLAQRVLDWRARHGRFSSVDELGEVSGIGPSRLADLSPLVRVGP